MKLEIRNPKSETISNQRMSNAENASRLVSSLTVFAHLNLFRISDFGFRISNWSFATPALFLTILFSANCPAASSSSDPFNQGSQAYIARGFEQSAVLFREAAAAAPASGTLHNLGNAEWQCGQTG